MTEDIRKKGARTRNKETGRTRNGRSRASRFYGSAKNDNYRLPPTTRKEATFLPCVDPAWMEEVSVSNLPMRVVPDDWTIFNLDIPESDFDQEELEWLAENRTKQDHHDLEYEADTEPSQEN
jgi:hypothetical protein